MAHLSLPPIATTTVGSFPRPPWLAEVDRADARFRPWGDLLKEVQDDATLLVLREQEQAGIDLATDGEQRRENFIRHILGYWDGIDLERKETKIIRRRAERQVPTVIGKVHRRSAAVVEDVRFAKANTALPVKMQVPGPVTVVDSVFDAAYGDERALALDVATAINAELRDLQEAGADVLQIDEPAMTRWHEKVTAYGAEGLDRCLEGITVPTIVHLCYGYPGGGPSQHEYEYPELLNLLADVRISGFSLEFARSGYDPAILAPVRDRLVMFGCVDPGDVREPDETVTQRVRAALRHVEPERLLLAPDCGLMTVSRGLAREKLEQLTRVASEVR